MGNWKKGEKKIIVYSSAFGYQLPDLDTRKMVFGNDDYHCPRIRTKMN